MSVPRSRHDHYPRDDAARFRRIREAVADLDARWRAAATDAVTTASGTRAFAYALPHDHNFHFLTAGYFGPGYISDDYEVDPEAIDGRLGEPLALRPAGQSQLGEGKMMLYRAHRDVHSQHPPPSLSVSLNIMDEREHIPWRDQYIVDLGGAAPHAPATIAQRPTLTSTELLLRAAVHLHENAHDIADHFAKAHPVPRVRAHALAAAEAGEGRAAVLERGLRDPDAQVRDDCRRWLATQCDTKFNDFRRESNLR